MALTGPPPTYTLKRDQYVRTRNGRVIKAQYLPGDSWIGWHDPVPDNIIGGAVL